MKKAIHFSDNLKVLGNFKKVTCKIAVTNTPLVKTLVHRNLTTRIVPDW